MQWMSALADLWSSTRLHHDFHRFGLASKISEPTVGSFVHDKRLYAHELSIRQGGKKRAVKSFVVEEGVSVTKAGNDLVDSIIGLTNKFVVVG